jgi:hypothetical protein
MRTGSEADTPSSSDYRHFDSRPKSLENYPKIMYFTFPHMFYGYTLSRQDASRDLSNFLRGCLNRAS